ncbi:MAG: DUF1501 domain-containing protein [Gammaproteobacteria bacterium]|nr:MAG: DUF1501 domain-containing protein [Gammaproteobacteria bacterium]
MAMQRREFLNLGALLAGGALLTSRVAFARTDERRPRFVLIIMRGALDGLATVPPYGDRDYAALRGEFALRAPGEAGGALPLDGFFGLHPSLAFLQQCYAARELTVLHALASPYRERSHFDGQDVLENGSPRARALTSGWLNRALASSPPPGQEAGVALGQNVPLVMRGPAAVTSWSASKLGALDEDTLARITDLYAADPLLSVRLADALAADAIACADGAVSLAATAPDTAPRAMSAAGTPPPARPAQANGARYAQVVRAAAGFLRQEAGPRVAMFDTAGWDTHANEGAAQGQLLLVTEFGRTAAINGTRGTDHGTATAALLVGGAVAGGRVIADWPGLSPRALYQGRDLAPTLDLRSVLKGLLHEHLQVPPRELERTVFPDSRTARPLTGLVRT